MSSEFAIEWSEKEKKMFKMLGFKNLECFKDPLTVYRICAEDAFRTKTIGPEVESLRRCIDAIYSGKIYRLTNEWDNLIIL